MGQCLASVLSLNGDILHIRLAWPPQVWNLEGMQVGSPPPLLRNLKPFAANQKMPEAAITCIALHEASWPRFTVAVGLATSQIYILRGGSGKAPGLPVCCLMYTHAPALTSIKHRDESVKLPLVQTEL